MQDTFHAYLREEMVKQISCPLLDLQSEELCYYKGDTKQGKPHGDGIVWSWLDMFIGQFNNGVRSAGFYYCPHQNIIAKIESNDETTQRMKAKLFFKTSNRELQGDFDYKFNLIGYGVLRSATDGWEFTGSPKLERKEDGEIVNCLMHGNGVLTYGEFVLKAAFQDDVPVNVVTISS